MKDLFDKGVISLNIILIGPPGAGKGTQASLIANKYNLPFVSSGDLFREHRKLGTKLGLLAEKYMNQGELVPDHVTIDMVMNWLDQNKGGSSGFLLDGFPRTVQQATSLEKALGNANPVGPAVYINVDKDELLRRLTGRRVCMRCQISFHIHSNPPLIQDQCDKCSKPLAQREDDNFDAVEARLDAYRRNTEPLVAYYDHQNVLIEIDGNETIRQVSKDIVESLDCFN
ncbi:MAG: adenylate kinase [SAR202 cluster bacterium]|nr:adenylate kinase [SAR202 cluster bacterium]|tara:strand:- start:13419 stop:14102 length:684 start_codon:yes stop_codon:yes gene_type:complete